MDKLLFTPETEVYILNMHNPNKPLHGYIREVITMTEYDSGYTTYQYDVRVDGKDDDTDLNIVNKRVSLRYILYAKCSDNWYAVKDLIKAAEMYYSSSTVPKPLIVGKYLKYFVTEHTPCVRDMMYELEHDDADCEAHNRAFYIMEKDSVDSLSYAYTYVKGKESRNKRYYNIPKYDLSASYNKKRLPEPNLFLSDQLKKKLKRIEVNGEYMTAVWYDHPATVIKLSENDMYDTEKAYMWLLLKGLCDNNKSECDRVLKLMEDITFEKK